MAVTRVYPGRLRTAGPKSKRQDFSSVFADHDQQSLPLPIMTVVGPTKSKLSTCRKFDYPMTTRMLESRLPLLMDPAVDSQSPILSLPHNPVLLGQISSSLYIKVIGDKQPSIHIRHVSADQNCRPSCSRSGSIWLKSESDASCLNPIDSGNHRAWETSDQIFVSESDSQRIHICVKRQQSSLN